ncbi:MAG: signal peptidase II [Chloroflexi bacterium]|nr:signal peptidase II [Chloroflexota bacterium]
MNTKTLAARAGVLAALALAADQATKTYVRYAIALCPAPPLSACDRLDVVGPVGLVRVENAGSVFGYSQGLGVWVLVALLGLLLIPLYMRKLPRATRLAAVAAGLQAGGALGNLADRLVHGGVADFIDAGWGPVFNLADVFIVAGMALAARLLLRAAGTSDGARFLARSSAHQ